MCPGYCNVDLSSDSANCGLCGHNCLGGACTDSVCQPFVVVQPLNDSTYYNGIASNGTSFVWTDRGNDLVGEYDIGGAPQDLATNQSPAESVMGPGPITIDGSTVYWLQDSVLTGNSSDLAQVTLQDYGDDMLLATVGGTASGLAAVGGLLWTTLFTASTTEATACDENGDCQPGEPYDYSGIPLPVGLSVAPDFNSSGIFYSNIGQGQILDTGTGSGYGVTAGYTAYFVARNAADSVVYWTEVNNADSFNIRFESAGTGGTLVSGGTGNPNGLASDGTNIYFILDQKLYYVPNTGGSPHYLAIAPATIENLAYVPNASWVINSKTVGGGGALIFDDTQNIYEISTPAP